MTFSLGDKVNIYDARNHRYPRKGKVHSILNHDLIRVSFDDAVSGDVGHMPYTDVHPQQLRKPKVRRRIFVPIMALEEMSGPKDMACSQTYIYAQRVSQSSVEFIEVIKKKK